MSILLNGDCLEEMKGIDSDSVDFIFCDLPYGQTSCKWDCKIDLDLFWKEIMRIKKINTPVIFTTTTKFGVELIQSAPKKCPFRYDIVWIKSSAAGFLSAKKMPMRKHEMVYMFYEKLPLYDLSSHKHKFIKEVPTKRSGKDGVDNKGMIKNRSKSGMEKINKYDPPLPVSVVKDDIRKDKHNTTYGDNIHYHNNEQKNGESIYDPPLPKSVVKEDCYATKERFKNGKLYKNPRHLQKGDDPIYDPPLPVSVVKEDQKNIYNFDPEQMIDDRPSNVRTPAYDPPLPNSFLEIKSTRGKHSTEKPVALIEWFLKYYSKEGDTVLDPTMGSGSTGVACKNMNRNFIGIEKDPEIYEVAVNRIED